VDSMVYFVNRGAEQILAMDRETEIVSPVIYGDQFGAISYDPFSNNLFWVDVHKMSVVVHSLSTSANMVAMSSTSSPLSVMFVPKKNRLVVGERGKISIVQLGNPNIREILSYKLGSPVSLAYAAQADAVFIGDAASRVIYRWDWGSEEVVPILENIGEVASMAVKDGLLYWVEKAGTSLLWISIHNSELSWLPINSIASPNDLLHLSVSGQDFSPNNTVNMACITAHCSHLCFNEDTSGHTCSCPYGMSLSRDKLTCQEDCPDNVFSCGDGQCVPLSWKCDGTADCTNLADEGNCTVVELARCDNSTQSTCDDGACILSSWWCDGDNDCPDGSDEKADCPVMVCGEDRFSCADQRQCVLTHWVCDGGEDCADGSDEADCQVACAADQFQCKDRRQCIQQGWVCDHNPDCQDASDEEDCNYTPLSCGRSEFSCDNKNCVSMDLFCNGDDDCGDGSDEAEQICHRRTEDPLPTTVQCQGGFACGAECLPLSARCNGSYECVDESDEENCSLCTEDTFSCGSGERCIPVSWLCDQTDDCSDGSDEADCPNKQEMVEQSCQSDQFHCFSGECIPLHLACNNHPDCLDSSDEDPAKCPSSCTHNGGCPQACMPTPRGAVCQCHPGYNLTTMLGIPLCLDTDECSLISTCSQTCTNTKGSYKCSCSAGYTVEGRHCRAGGEPPKLLYASHSNINGIMIRPGSAYRINMELTSHAVPIKSFDYNPTSHEFYWTSPALGVIGRYNVDIGERSKNEVWLSGIEKPDQVVVDWITGNVYFSQQSSSTIVVCGKEEEKNAECAHLCTVPVTSITLMVLDPREGRLFAAGFSRVRSGYPRGAVYPFSMDGEPVASAMVLGAEKTGIPSGLALDTRTRRVFWSDVTSRDISVCTYEGTNCQVVVTSSHSHPNFLSFYESKLYWLAGSKGLVHTHDILEEETQARDDLSLPAYSHSLKFVHSSLTSPLPPNPCSTLNCSSLCLLTLTSARCACPTGSVPHDSLSQSCLYPTHPAIQPAKPASVQPATPASDLSSTVPASTPSTERQMKADAEYHDEVTMEMAENTDGKINGVTLAIVILIILVVTVVVLIFVVRFKASRKKPDVSLTFSNLAYNTPTPGLPDRELNSVQIVQRGTTVGYDNPGFDSPVDFFKRRSAGPKLSSMGWAGGPGIGSGDPVICEGSSTPAVSRATTRGKDTDSAFQEPSLAASSFDDNRFSVDEDDDLQQHMSVSFYKDKHRLIN